MDLVEFVALHRNNQQGGCLLSVQIARLSARMGEVLSGILSTCPDARRRPQNQPTGVSSAAGTAGGKSCAGDERREREEHQLGALKRDAGRGASRPQIANLIFSPRKKTTGQSDVSAACQAGIRLIRPSRSRATRAEPPRRPHRSPSSPGKDPHASVVAAGAGVRCIADSSATISEVVAQWLVCCVVVPAPRRFAARPSRRAARTTAWGSSGRRSMRSHVTWCHFTHETRLRNVKNDLASTAEYASHVRVALNSINEGSQCGEWSLNPPAWTRYPIILTPPDPDAPSTRTRTRRLMGRQSGFIAMHAALASGEVDVCLIPEINTPLDGQGGVLVGLRGTCHRTRSFQTLYTTRKCRSARL